MGLLSSVSLDLQTALISFANSSKEIDFGSQLHFAFLNFLTIALLIYSEAHTPCVEKQCFKVVSLCSVFLTSCSRCFRLLKRKYSSLVYGSKKGVIKADHYFQLCIEMKVG